MGTYAFICTHPALFNGFNVSDNSGRWDTWVVCCCLCPPIKKLKPRKLLFQPLDLHCNSDQSQNDTITSNNDSLRTAPERSKSSGDFPLSCSVCITWICGRFQCSWTFTRKADVHVKNMYDVKFNRDSSKALSGLQLVYLGHIYKKWISRSLTEVLRGFTLIAESHKTSHHQQLA